MINVKPGDQVMACYRDKWEPSTVIKADGNWIVVRIEGRITNTKVPLDAVKLNEPATKPPAPDPQPETVTADPVPIVAYSANNAGLRLDEIGHYIRLYDGAKAVTAFPMAHRQHAEEVLLALREWRAAKAVGLI